MRHPFLRAFCFLSAAACLVLLAACGGSAEQPFVDAAGSGAGCTAALPCTLPKVWDWFSCSCSLDGAAPEDMDASGSQCDGPGCQPAMGDAGKVADEGPETAALDAAPADADGGGPSDAPLVTDTAPSDGPAFSDATPSDATFFDTGDVETPDSGVVFGPDASTGPVDATASEDVIVVFSEGGFCGIACPSGYTVSDSSCQCEPCSATCPAGQTPGPGCGGCVTCSLTCPAGDQMGPNCQCIPPGSQPVPPDAGVTCLLQGYTQCAAGTWCELGVCPDGKTQYGCYCNRDGTANCQVTCPPPPDCSIPGHGTCPYGSECLYQESCASDAGGVALICSCETNGTAYCYTQSCSTLDGGLFDSGASSDGGVTCNLEGYYNCPAGTYCQLGSCPDGTPYGCTCNQDGTATCQLVCPGNGECVIPGEGICSPGQTCTYGTCGTEVLTCYCEQGGRASCYTSTTCDGGLD